MFPIFAARTLQVLVVLPLFQSGESMIGHLHGEMTRLLRKLLGRFVTTRVIREESTLTKVVYNKLENQHEDERLAVGWRARDYLSNNDVNPEVTQKFFRYNTNFISGIKHLKNWWTHAKLKVIDSYAK